MQSIFPDERLAMEGETVKATANSSCLFRARSQDGEGPPSKRSRDSEAMLGGRPYHQGWLLGTFPYGANPPYDCRHTLPCKILAPR